MLVRDKNLFQKAESKFRILGGLHSPRGPRRMHIRKGERSSRATDKRRSSRRRAGEPQASTCCDVTGEESPNGAPRKMHAFCGVPGLEGGILTPRETNSLFGACLNTTKTPARKKSARSDSDPVSLRRDLLLQKARRRARFLGWICVMLLCGFSRAFVLPRCRCFLDSRPKTGFSDTL